MFACQQKLQSAWRVTLYSWEGKASTVLTADTAESAEVVLNFLSLNPSSQERVMNGKSRAERKGKVGTKRKIAQLVWKSVLTSESGTYCTFSADRILIPKLIA